MKNNIDTQLYSRQLCVYDINTMIKLSKMKILILGMRGLGIEVAKNLILSGPQEVIIYDPNKVEKNDLNSNFYLNEDIIEKSSRRDKIVINQLKELNPYVICDILEGYNFKNKDEEIDYILQIIKNFSLIVITEFLTKKIIEKIELECRKEKKGLIYGCAMGISSFIFEDFGEKHMILNPYGKDITYYPICDIKKGKKTIIKIENTEDGFPVLNDDSMIKINKINGMTELNSNCYNVNQISSFEYEIDVDSTNFNDYLNGGYIEEVIIPKEIKGEIFNESILNPIKGERKFFDSSYIGRKDLVHSIILSLYDNRIDLKEGNNILSTILPNLNDKNFAKKIINISKEYFYNGKKNNENWINILDEYEEEIKLNDFDEKLVYHIALWLRAEIPPMVSFLGGVIAQEIIKYTGKFTPFNQWSWFEFEYLVRELNENEINREPLNSRYDEQISIFGQEIQQKLENLNIFLVGAGAAGCEYLKNFAMMGVSSITNNNKGGCLTLTDFDCIEISNLNRQFLFRKEDIGKTKSEVASKRIINMNPNFNCKVFNAKIGPENEHIFNDNFWEKQNIVFNAVDNKEARQYIDQKVTEFSLNSFDVGTLGTSATSSIFLNNSTLSYIELNPISKNDENTNNIGLCTIHAFPSTITHCIEWSRDQFEKYFTNDIKFLKKIFLGNQVNFKILLMKEGLPIFQLKKLNKISKLIDIYLEEDYEKAIQYAFDIYYENFNENIKKILKNHPPDSKNKDGSLFFSGTKKIPIPVKEGEGNINELCLIYIKSFADLLFDSFGIKKNNQYENEYIIKILNNKKEIETYIDEKMTFELVAEKISIFFNEKKNILINSKKKNIEKDLKEIKFDKDNNENGQNDFIYAGANLRAWNYQIPQCDKIKSSIIAGKIVASIAATNACITGLVAMQLYLLVQYDNFEDKLELFRNYFIDIGICSFDFSYPPKKIVHENQNDIPKGWSIWDYIKIKGPLTISNFIIKIKEDFGINVDLIVSQKYYFYNPQISGEKSNQLIEDLFEEITKLKVKNNKSSLILKIIGKKNNYSVNMPLIKYIFR